MTIGIGLVCDSGKHILLGADTRGTYGVATSSDQTAKLFDLAANYCGAVSGSMGQCQDIIFELDHRMKQLNSAEIYPEQARKCIADSYKKILFEKAHAELWNQVKITLDDYRHDNQLAQSVRDHALEVLNAIEIDADLIVCGFCHNSPVQLVVTGGKSVTIRPEMTPGNAVIGTGAVAALNWLNYREQCTTVGLARSAFHLSEAKQFSEVDKHVGPFSNTVLLWSGGFKPLEGQPGSDLVQSWWNRYGLPLSIGLEQETHEQDFRNVYGLRN